MDVSTGARIGEKKLKEKENFERQSIEHTSKVEVIVTWNNNKVRKGMRWVLRYLTTKRRTLQTLDDRKTSRPSLKSGTLKGKEKWAASSNEK